MLPFLGYESSVTGDTQFRCQGPQSWCEIKELPTLAGLKGKSPPPSPISGPSWISHHLPQIDLGLTFWFLLTPRTLIYLKCHYDLKYHPFSHHKFNWQESNLRVLPGLFGSPRLSGFHSHYYSHHLYTFLHLDHYGCQLVGGTAISLVVWRHGKGFKVRQIWLLILDLPLICWVLKIV